MTDEELKLVIKDLKPKHDWKAIIGVIVGAAGVAWGVARWAATVPTGEQFEKTTNRLWELQRQQDRMGAEVTQGKNDVADVKQTVNEIRVNVQQLKDRKR